MKAHHSGLSLLELLIVITISCTLITLAVSAPSSIERNRIHSSMKSLSRLAQYARLISIDQNIIITLCGTDTDKRCIKNWNNTSTLVFYDKNNNKAYDKGEPLYREQKLNNNISWKGSNRNYMRFHPEGYLMDWGSYNICPKKTNQDSLKLVFNRLGRAYSKPITFTDITNQQLCSF